MEKLSIEKMLETGQPIRVVERDGLLVPVYIAVIEEVNKQQLQNKTVEESINILTRNFEFEPFRSEHFFKVQQTKIHHANCTTDFSRITFDNLEPVYTFIRDIFYFAPQSDAIGYRQRWYKNPQDLIFYQPRIVDFKEIESQEVPEPKRIFPPEGQEDGGIVIYEKEDRKPFFFVDGERVCTLELDLFIPKDVSLHESEQEIPFLDTNL